jgi:hypothetical protein
MSDMSALVFAAALLGFIALMFLIIFATTRFSSKEMILNLTPREADLILSRRGMYRSLRKPPEGEGERGEEFMEEGFWAPMGVYDNGVQGRFGSVRLKRFGWGQPIRGRFAVTKQRYQYIPFEDMSGIYPINVEDHTDQNRARWRTYFAFQIETWDYRTGIIRSEKRPEDLSGALRSAVGPLWRDLYDNSRTLHGTMTAKWVPSGEDSERPYYFAWGDLHRHKLLRDAGLMGHPSEGLGWSGRNLSLFEMIRP